MDLNKNFFFKKFKKFGDKKALIFDSGKYVSYKKLIKNSEFITKKLIDTKELVFLLGENNEETVTGYISFVNKGYLVYILDYKISSVLLKRLILSYEPSFIFCSKNRKISSKRNQRNHAYCTGFNILWFRYL